VPECGRSAHVTWSHKRLTEGQTCLMQQLGCFICLRFGGWLRIASESMRRCLIAAGCFGPATSATPGSRSTRWPAGCRRTPSGGGATAAPTTCSGAHPRAEKSAAEPPGPTAPALLVVTVAEQRGVPAAVTSSTHLRTAALCKGVTVRRLRLCASAGGVQVHQGQGRLRARRLCDGREGGARCHRGQLHLAHALLLQQRPRLLGLAARPLACLLWCAAVKYRFGTFARLRSRG
jgi:hypothetical protein